MALANVAVAWFCLVLSASGEEPWSTARPAQTCQDSGLASIFSPEECKNAVLKMGMWWSEYQEVRASAMPAGCNIFLQNKTLILNLDATLVPQDEENDYRVVVCTTPRSVITVGPEEGGTPIESIRYWILAVVALLITASVLVGVNRGCVWAARSEAIRCRQKLRCKRNDKGMPTCEELKSITPESAMKLEVMDLMAKRREIMVDAFIALTTISHVVELFLATGSEEIVPGTGMECPRGNRPGSSTYWVHFAGSLLLSAGLVFCRVCGLPRRLLLVAEFVFRVLVVFADPKAILLSPARCCYDVIWLAAMGACSSGVAALCQNLVYHILLAIAYAVFVPNGMVPIVQTEVRTLYNSWSCIGFFHKEDVATVARRISALPQGTDTQVALAEMVQRMGLHVTALKGFLLEEIVVITVVFILSSLCRRWLLRQVSTSVRLAGSQTLSSTLSLMLSRVCDCMIILDSDLCISSPALQFVSLLHHLSRDFETVGTEMLSYVDLEEREEVKIKLEAAGNGMCEIMHVSLRDAFGIRVPCQVFHVRTAGLGGKSSYVLSINQLAEREHQPADMAVEIEQRIQEQEEERVGNLENHAIPESLPQEVRDTYNKSRSPQMGLPQMGLPEVGLQEEMNPVEEDESGNTSEALAEEVGQADFNALDGIIMASTEPFRKLVGQDPINKQIWGLFEDPGKFHKWLQSCLDVIAKNEDQEAFCSHFKGVFVRKDRPSQTRRLVKMEVLFPPRRRSEIAEGAAYIISVRSTTTARLPSSNQHRKKPRRHDANALPEGEEARHGPEPSNSSARQTKRRWSGTPSQASSESSGTFSASCSNSNSDSEGSSLSSDGGARRTKDLGLPAKPTRGHLAL
mmetsp:Transcript_37094/g.105324  ORF Transcript_37094/g.105324 Transcript_37094/m.105324 type:complete len:858 (-) Transcript_37094:245-2818(-)